MTDFLENLLNSMSTAFNSSPTPADGAPVVDLNLSEDKTMKWRGLLNNQNPRKHGKRPAEKEEKPPQGQPKTPSSAGQVDKEKVTAGPVADGDDDGTTCALAKKEDPARQTATTTTTTAAQKPQNRSLDNAENIGRRLRRSRPEPSVEAAAAAAAADTSSKSSPAEDKPPPKRRGRAKKVTDDKEKSLVTQKSAEVSAMPEQHDTDNGPTRKLRRSERNASAEIKTEADEAHFKPAEKDPVHKEDSSVVDGETEVTEKNTRRSMRLGNRAEADDSSLKSNSLSTIAEFKDHADSKSVDGSIVDNIEIKPTQLQDVASETVEAAIKQNINEKTPKKRGRRSKVSSQEKVTNSETKKVTKSASKVSSENSSPSLSTQKEKPTERTSTAVASSQRPLRRIKPTAKILENDELRYEFETKNIARMTACTDLPIEIEDSKPKKEEKEKAKDKDKEGLQDGIPSAAGAEGVKKKLFLKTNHSSLNVDNIYPKANQKPCPDPEVFLNEIKAAKINLHKSPEDKKLNKRQHRKLLKQKERHFEKLGLRRNTKSELSDSIESSSDNEEFVPSKKVRVGRTHVTLRVRGFKDEAVVLKEGQKIHQKRRANTVQENEQPTKVANHSTTNEIFHEHEELICLCQKLSKFYTPYTPETSFCCAIDNIEEQKVGCCNQLSGELLNLLRPSVRVGYMILCDDHKKRLRAHNCCSGCGIFCTQGNFMLCPQKHFFHPNCAQKFVVRKSHDRESPPPNYASPALVLKCPHCGTDTPEKSSLITMKCQSLPVFYPSQKSSMKPAMMTIPDGSSCPPPEKRKLLHSAELDKLIPESVMNVVVREGNSMNEFTSRDMFYSINNDDLERVAEIIASGYDITSEMQEFLNGTCLHLVAHFGTIQMAYLLLCRDSSDHFLNLLDKEMRTAMMCAIIGDKLDIFKLFIQCGANLSVKGPDGMTCLHVAAKLGSHQAAQMIVEAFRNSTSITSFEKFLNSPDDGGWTAMVWAAENGYTDIVSLLLANGADPNICDTENNTVLHWATLSNHMETILALLRANVSCSGQNINGDTPLHIACRQSCTRICLMLIANGADLMVKNKAEELPYDCIPDEDSQCARAVGFNMQMRSFGPAGLRNKIISSDVSNGREVHPIQVLKCDRSNTPHLDDVFLPDFKYITKSILLQNSIQIDCRVAQMRICNCNDGCNTSDCQCSTISIQNWYTPEGRLNGEFNYNDPAMIFECNDVCGCNKLACKNRVVQNGIRIPLQVYECEERSKGWGVRSQTTVPKGSFVAEYTGEILTDMEADRRTDDSYFFDLGASEHCIDANYYGNVSRFFNHSCSPNIVPVRVFFDHQDLRFPKIAFFACRDITAGEELTFDYGDKFWAVKQKFFPCVCRSSRCKYATAAKTEAEN